MWFQASNNQLDYRNVTVLLQRNYFEEFKYEEDSKTGLRYVLGPFGCLFNIINITFFFFNWIKNTTSTAHELIAYVNISSLINTISYLLLYITSDQTYSSNLCVLQGSIMLYSEFSLMICLTAISLHIFTSMERTSDDMERSERIKYIIFIYLLPFVLIMIGGLFKIFGENGNWCWIKAELGSSLGLIVYIGIWILLVFNSILTIFANIKIQNITTFNSVAFTQIKYYISYIRKISIFPIILIICWIPASINRIRAYFLGGKDETIQTLHLIFNLSLGIFLSIASFLFLDWVKIFHKFKKVFSCKECFNSSKYQETESSFKQNYLLSSSDFVNS